MINDEKERELQQRIFASPSLLPGFDEPTAAAKEVPVRRAGSADVVVVNRDGQIAIVECKRATNPESRRWVIGQVFEYAAGLWKLDYSDFERILEARGTALTRRFEGVPRWDEETFRRAVSRNLMAGDFRLFIAVDAMTEGLKKRLHRTVAFLNSQLPKVQFLALAVPQDGPVEVYGDDWKAIPPLPPKLKPDRWTLIDETTSPAAAAVAEELFDWADRMKARGVELEYTPTQCIVKAPRGRLFRVRPREVQVALSAVIKEGEPWDEPTEQLVQELDEIGVRLKGNRPRAPLELLADEPMRARFLVLMERHLGTLTG